MSYNANSNVFKMFVNFCSKTVTCIVNEKF